MTAIEMISQDLFDKVRSRYSNLEMGDEDGQVTTDPREARFFDFDFILEGHTLGRVSISLNERGTLKIFYSQGILEGQSSITKDMWFDFLREMRQFAKRRLLSFDTRDITKQNLDKTDFEYLANAGSKEENMSESKMYGSRKSSYLNLENAKLIIRHKKNYAVDETIPGARSRHIEHIFIENADGERFKYPFIHIAGAKAMQRHVANGGRPHDICGQKIISMSEDIAKLSAFRRHVPINDSMNSGVHEIMERTTAKLESLKKEMAALSRQKFYENWKVQVESADQMLGDDFDLDPVTLEDYKHKFTVRSFKEDLAQYFPLIHRIMRESGTLDLDSVVNKTTQPVKETSQEKVSEFDQFESWADNVVGVVEATVLTDDQIENLKELLSSDVTLGVDATDAVNSLKAIGINSEKLMSALESLADTNPEADPKATIVAWASKLYPEHSHEFADAAGLSDEEAPNDVEGKPKKTVDKPTKKSAPPPALGGGLPPPPMGGLPPPPMGGGLGGLGGGAPPMGGGAPPMGGGMPPMMETEEDKLDQKPTSKKSSPKELAKFIKSFWNREEHNFPIGETGLLVKVKKEFGDHASRLAERLINHLLDTHSEITDESTKYSQGEYDVYHVVYTDGTSEDFHYKGDIVQARRYLEAKGKQIDRIEYRGIDTSFVGGDLREGRTKQRLDKSCWSGYHKEGTKVKGGTRVNNCVKNESIEEAKSPEEFQNWIDQTVINTKPTKLGSKFDDLYNLVEVELMSLKVVTDDLYSDIRDILKKLKIKPKELLIDKLIRELYVRQSQVLNHYDDPWGDRNVSEGWSKKYKDSINCSHPKGFSQRAHCASKTKNESVNTEDTEITRIIDLARKK